MHRMCRVSPAAPIKFALETVTALNLQAMDFCNGGFFGRADYLSGSCEKEQLSWQTDEITKGGWEIPSHALIWFTIIASKRRI